MTGPNRTCAFCPQPMPADAPKRAKYCSDLCRKAAAKWRPSKADRTGPERTSAKHRTEGDLQREVLKRLGQLKRAGLILAYNHIAPKRSHKDSRNVETGVPDLLIAVRPDCILFAELKRPDRTGRISPQQEVWLRCAGRAGCVATEWRDVAELLEDHGVCADLA